ncbi:MAG TPA: hypothetical protein VFL14_09465 [Xanthomonadales bacterium]|nr:hypothetical protein [Xanthomonadales bacterium]
MNTAIRYLLVALLASLALVACKKEEQAKPAAPVAAPVVTLTVPTNDDREAWKAYLSQVVKANMEGRKYRRPFVYWIPGGDDEESQRQYQDQLDNVSNAVGRGIQAGSMIAFGSSNSTKMADLVVESFKYAAPKSLKGVRVVFIGATADEQRVRDAVAPSEADFVFVEAK